MNFQQVSDETLEIFKKCIDSVHLDNLKYEVLSSKLKKSKDDMCGKVIIQNPLQRHISNVDVVFLVNEDVFDRLSEQSQTIVADKLVAQVGYDLEKDKVLKSAPDIQEHKAILKKYTFNLLEATSIEITQIYEKLSEESTDSNGDEIED